MPVGIQTHADFLKATRDARDPIEKWWISRWSGWGLVCLRMVCAATHCAVSLRRAPRSYFLSVL